MDTDSRMNAAELHGSLALALIFFLRMFGLFLILPVFTLYAETLADATPLLIGIALGIYGLTQALFQIPFGMLSDRIGRKKVIVAGLLIFGLGSIMAGASDSIRMIIAGRALQGAGAIAAAIMALAADLTRSEQRSKSMALIGISVGVAFALAFIAGPMLNPVIGVPGMFYLGAVLAIFAIAVLLLLIPNTEPAHKIRTHSFRVSLVATTASRKLLLLYASIFILHMLLMANFVVIPLTLRDAAGVASADHWHLYLPVLVLSGLLMLPCLLLGEKFRRVNQVFAAAIALMIVAQYGFFQWHHTALQIGVVMVLFFLSFNYLEATLPSLISKSAPAADKGTALGIYSTCQFIGIFTGGTVGGYLFQHTGINSVFVFGCAISILWLAILIIVQNPIKHREL